MRRLPLLLLLSACVIDNGLGVGKDGSSDFDTSSDWEPPTDTSEDEDTDHTGVPKEDCPEPILDAITVAPDEECEEPVVVGTFTPEMLWEQEGIGDAYTTPVVGNLTDDDGDGDVDEDDIPDVVVGGTGGSYAAVSGDDGRILWTASGSLGGEPMTAAIGDIDLDGWPDVVGAGASGTTAWHGEDGSQLWTRAAYAAGNSPQCGAVGIHDLDGDGQPEVIIGKQILNGDDGSERGVGSLGDGASHSWAAPIGAAADIDLDGVLEVVVGNALYDPDGNTIISNSETDGAIAVANFDGDPEGEIVVTRAGNVRLQDDDLSVIWELVGIAGSTVGTPTVADFDGDGEPEIGVAGNGTYIVLDADGSLLWQQATKDFSSGFTGSSVFDFEGDGAAEVVYADEDNVFVYDGATGAIKMQETRHSSATCSEYPSVADVDNDGHADIVYTSSTYSGPEKGVRAIKDQDDSWRRGPLSWNQHAYNITNVNEDGSIPAYPDVNWATYNNYRSGDLSAGTGGLASDAVVEVTDTCNVECDRGYLRIVIVVANRGMGNLPAAIPVSLYSMQHGNAVYESTQWTTAELLPGTSTTGLVFELDPVVVVDGYVEFRVDDDGTRGTVEECHEDNNTTLAIDGLCP